MTKAKLGWAEAQVGLGYFIDKTEALAREKFFKSGFGRNELKKALKHTLKGLGYKKL